MSIKRALISVSDKNGLTTLASGLAELGVEIISTSGTASFLGDAGVRVTTVEELTGAPELLGGRVKTLHSTLHAAILARRDHDDDMRSLAAAGIEPIDLVVCNLYPFRSVAMRRGVPEPEVIANIDIGGPAMVRAAAKNFHSVAVVTEPDRYGFLLDEIRNSKGELSLDTRRDLAAEAFAHVASYDAAIAAWFSDTEPFPERVTLDLLKVSDLTLRREPAPARRPLSRGRRPPAPALSDRAARRKAALVQQPDRPPGGAHDRVGLPGAVLRGREAREPRRRGGRRDDRGRLRTGARHRPAGGVRSGDRRQQAGRRGACEADARDEGRPPLRPGLRRGRPRGAERQDVDAGARGPRAAQELTRRAGHAPGARRHPDPGPRPRGRGPLGHAGRDRDASPASASGTTSCSRGGSRTSCTPTRSCS